MKDAFLTLGRGVGQVMFQNNALSGVIDAGRYPSEFLANGLAGDCG